MLTSLFGELGLAKRPVDDDFPDTSLEPGSTPAAGAAGPDATPMFSASAVLESTDTRVDAQGRLVDRHVKDLFITGSPAAAMRTHFANRSDPQAAAHAITLHDPTGVWAPAVVKALADASGHPIERLQLRHQATLGTLAMIERTRLHRRGEPVLKIYHADVRSSDAGSADIPIVLMERSQLAVVIVGTMPPESIDEWLLRLQRAVRAPGWHCPSLLFVLPPTAVWIATRLQGLQWPVGLRVTTLQEPLTSASAVWNALLDAWNDVKDLPRWAAGDDAAAGDDGLSLVPRALQPAAVAWPRYASGLQFDARASAPPPRPATASAGASAATPGESADGDVLNAARAVATLHALSQNDGLLGCAIIDEDHSTLVARSTDAVDLEMAAAASVQLWRAHRVAARLTEDSARVDEIIQGTGTRHLVMRRLARHPGRFMMAVLDRRRANLTLVRLRMQEADRQLA